MQDCCDKMICLYSLLFWNLTAYSWYRSTLQTYVFLEDINQFGQSIYHFIESPRLIDFKNTKIIWNFDVASCHIAQRSINWLPVLSRSIAAYEQRHIRRTIQPEVFPNLLVHQSSVIFFLQIVRCLIYLWHKALEQILTTSHLRYSAATKPHIICSPYRPGILQAWMWPV